jgi:hypothetical protein
MHRCPAGTSAEGPWLPGWAAWRGCCLCGLDGAVPEGRSMLVMVLAGGSRGARHAQQRRARRSGRLRIATFLLG